jgi:hypothetical protein
LFDSEYPGSKFKVSLRASRATFLFLFFLREILHILNNIRRSAAAFGAASSFEMSEHGDEVFQSDSRQGEHHAFAILLNPRLFPR